MKYNQSATDLANVKAWWNALSAADQSQQKNIDSLVEHTEQVLQFELDGWVQQMQNALAELRKDQVKAPEKNDMSETAPDKGAAPVAANKIVAGDGNAKNNTVVNKPGGKSGEQIV